MNEKLTVQVLIEHDFYSSGARASQPAREWSAAKMLCSSHSRISGLATFEYFSWAAAAEKHAAPTGASRRRHCLQTLAPRAQ